MTLSSNNPPVHQGDCICPPTKPPFDAILDPLCPVHGDEAARLLVDAIDSGTLIAAQPDGRCELCGATAETRPYGPNGEEICHPCGKKDPATTERQMAKRLGVKR